MKSSHIYTAFLLFLSLLLSCQNDNFSPTESDSANIFSLDKKGGSSLDFDGASGYVEVPHDNSLNITEGLTISAWIYLESYTQWASVVTKGGFFAFPDGDPQDNNYTLHQSGPFNGGTLGKLRFTGGALFPFGLPESNTVIPINEWHHVAVTFDGTTVKFYLDGIPDGELDIIGPLIPNTNDLRIGVDIPGDDEFWDGKLDEVKIWEEALSHSQIITSMHGSATPRARSLVGYWRFDEGSGTIANDRSRYHNDGSLNGGVTWESPGAPK